MDYDKTSGLPLDPPHLVLGVREIHALFGVRGHLFGEIFGIEQDRVGTVVPRESMAPFHCIYRRRFSVLFSWIC